MIWLNYSGIKYCDIANGPGTRTSLFVSGCRQHCKGCFNQGTWSFLAGDPFDDEVQRQVIESLEPFYVHGLTVLGGEPMEPENQAGLLPFLRRVREAQPEKTIWCFTGYLLDDLGQGGRKHAPETAELLSLVNVLVDGPFVEARHDVNLRFRGSSNQRIIDLDATRAAGALPDGCTLAGEPVLWEDDPVFSTHTMS